MSYDQGGGYPPQRPYAGPAAQRPAPRGGGPPQQYDQYGGDGYGYDQQGGYDNGGWDQGGGYGGGSGYDDYGPGGGAGRGPPPPRGDYYAGGPPPPVRGGSLRGPGPGPGGPGPAGPGGRMYGPPRGGGPGPGPYPPRGGMGPPGPPRGGGVMGGGPYPPRGGMGSGGRPPMGGRIPSDESNPNRGPPRSPQDYSGGPYPSFPGQQRRPDLDDESQIASHMNGLDVNDVPRRQDSYRAADGGRGDYNNYPPPQQRGPPGPPRGGGYGGGGGYRGGPDPGYDGYGGEPQQGYGGDSYGPPPQGPPPGGFGPPSRSMTMPANNNEGAGFGRGGGMPPRLPPADAPYNGPIGRNMPPRPSTAQGNRPPPQRMYPGQPGPYPQPGGGAYDDSSYGGPGQAAGGPPGGRASFGDVYDTYFESGRRASEGGYGVSHGMPPQRSGMPEFSSGPAPFRGSLDQQPGAHRYAGDLNRTKSQPDLRQPQTAIFEMAGDIPPMPPAGGNGSGAGGAAAGGGGPGGANGPPQQQQQGPALVPPPQFTMSSHPDALPSHPTPVRPGLMPNSVVSQVGSAKPAPVRQYGETPSPASSVAQGSMGGRPGPQGPPSNGSMTSGAPSSASSMQAPAISAPGAPPPEPQHVPVTTEELERLRVAVKADPSDQETALLLARRLVEAADTLANAMPDAKLRQRSRERYTMDAHKILKRLAGSGQNAEAMFFLADCLGKGIFGPEPENKEAFTLYQSAAKLGHAAAAYRTAVCCEIGSEEGGGTRKDPLKAMQWYKRAAMLGDTPAMYKVGMILLKGLLGQQRNPREAVGWLKRAAERADAENPHALHELGLLYESAQPNDVILRDEAYALSLFRQAAELGYKFSQFRLGRAYEYGTMGCPIDPRLSIMWYSRAAAQGEHQSELALSGWYLTGAEGILQQSDTEAYLWARKAAMAGLAKAEYAMGYFTEVGIGVPANLEDAKRWYWRAAAQDFPKARERLEDLKRTGKSGPRQRERISRSKIGKQQEGECTVM